MKVLKRTFLSQRTQQFYKRFKEVYRAFLRNGYEKFAFYTLQNGSSLMKTGWQRNGHFQATKTDFLLYVNYFPYLFELFRQPFLEQNKF